jgi:hypothetical protein
MTETKPKRRWSTFSLRTLLVLVAIVGIATGWYVNRLRIIKLEREKLAGKWVLDDGRILEFSVDHCDIGVPSDGIGQMDFHMNPPVTLPDGTRTNLSRAIYQINGNQIRIAQSDPGNPRPSNFEEGNGKANVFSGERTAAPKQGR